MRLATRIQGQGPAVVWLHGYTMDASTWSDLWSLLPGWTHVGVDLPGHGRSDPIGPGTTLPAAAAAIAAVVEEHGASRLVALSFGTILALQLALDRPDLIERLVLAAPAMGGGGTEPGADVRYLQLMALYRERAPAAQLADAWMESPPDIFRGTESLPMLRFRLRSVIMRHSWAELGNGALAALALHRHTDADLASIRARLLVLVGDQDMPVTQAVSERMAQLVPTVSRRVVAGAGHLAPLERPAACAPIVQAHLSG